MTDDKEDKYLIYNYLDIMVQEGASDLYITNGLPAIIKVESNFVRLKEGLHSQKTIEDLVKEFLTEEQWLEFNSTLELNIALSDENDERFRVNIFFQQRQIGMVVRHIKSYIPSFEELNLPDNYREFILKKRGLFLMAGATGSGKSTSIAAMLEYRNLHGDGHIVTIEDPIEYVFHHKNCIFTQREVNIDTYSYGIALKNALRQAPDVLFIGEIRDRDSMESAIAFSETGHLVVATIHANNTPQTLERVLSFYPEDVHSQLMVSLSHNLTAVVGQRLVKGVNGHNILAYEIMKNEGLITDLIKEEKINDIKDVMVKNFDRGMVTFDECLYSMFRKRLITSDVAIMESDNPNNQRLKISQYSDSNLSTDLGKYTKTTAAEFIDPHAKNEESNF